MIVGEREGRESIFLTLIERQTHFQIIRLFDGRDADSVDYAIPKIMAEYDSVIKWITADNGSFTCDTFASEGARRTSLFCTPIHFQ